MSQSSLLWMKTAKKSYCRMMAIELTQLLLNLVLIHQAVLLVTKVLLVVLSWMAQTEQLLKLTEQSMLLQHLQLITSLVQLLLVKKLQWQQELLLQYLMPLVRQVLVQTAH